MNASLKRMRDSLRPEFLLLAVMGLLFVPISCGKPGTPAGSVPQPALGQSPRAPAKQPPPAGPKPLAQARESVSQTIANLLKAIEPLKDGDPKEFV